MDNSIRTKVNTFMFIPLLLVITILYPNRTCIAKEKENYPKLLKIYKYNNSIFTQGLELKKSNSELFFSSGLYGKSFVGKIDLKSGIVKKKRLKKSIFAEGLTVTNKKIWLLTWQEGKVFILNEKNFKITKVIRYNGIGWGIANDGKKIFLSNGTNEISIRNKNTFLEEKRLRVVNTDNTDVYDLNELECASGYIYANKWHSNYIYKINKFTGQVIKKYNCSKIINKENVIQKENVLNGIAHLSKNTFLITGKRWSHIYKVILN